MSYVSSGTVNSATSCFTALGSATIIGGGGGSEAADAPASLPGSASSRDAPVGGAPSADAHEARMPSTSSMESLCAATANDMSDACISSRSHASNSGCAFTTAATHSRNFPSASASANASASSGASLAACVRRPISDARTSPARTDGFS